MQVVFWGFRYYAKDDGANCNDYCETWSYLASSFVLTGLILVCIGYFAFNEDTYWKGCGGNTSPKKRDVTAQYVHHPLFQANLTANEIVLEALCSTQKAVDCVAACDVPTPQSSICGTCGNELAACAVNLTANATSMLNLTIDTGEGDAYVFNYTVSFNAAQCRCSIRCSCPPFGMRPFALIVTLRSHFTKKLRYESGYDRASELTTGGIAVCCMVLFLYCLPYTYILRYGGKYSNGQLANSPSQMCTRCIGESVLCPCVHGSGASLP